MNSKILINGREVEYQVIDKSDRFLKIQVGDSLYQYCLITKKLSDGIIKKRTESGSFLKKVLFSGEIFQVEGIEARIETFSKRRSQKHGHNEKGHMLSPMPGKILKILVVVGDQVQEGRPLIIMEAMKMEHTIKANCEGCVQQIYFGEGDQVDGGVDLIELESKE